MKKRYIAIFALAPVVVVIGAAVLYILFGFLLIMPSSSDLPVADYGTFSLEGRPDGESYEFYKFITDIYGSSLAPIYIETPDGRRFLLSEFPEEVAEEIFGKVTPRVPSPRRATDPVRVIYWGRGNDVKFSFINGKLDSVSISQAVEEFRISPHKDGPYLELPIPQEKMIEVFGEPREWNRGLGESHGP